MKTETFNLEAYLNKGIENIVNSIIKSSAKNPRASLFMMQYALQSKKAEKLRNNWAEKGMHIPPFLIASITNKCNLHCAGCYARENHSCFDDIDDKKINNLISPSKWEEIFKQAVDIGISFILLAGGEPFVRKDVLASAGKFRSILFPVFTNGTMINDEYIRLLDRNRNLIPVLSIEGNQQTTDIRRGQGVYERLQQAMRLLSKSRILFGASVTVTTANLQEVFSFDFIENLGKSGCRSVIYVEYVPMDSSTANLALDDSDRAVVNLKLSEIRSKYEDMLFIEFPGDEKSSGGCLAAGRGFFHINPFGDAEPCPFSPYSDTSLLDKTLLEALSSPLFGKLQNNGSLIEKHTGGCTLFEQEALVMSLAGGTSK